MLSTDLGARWDNLSGDTLVAKSQALVAWAERNERMVALVIAVASARPGIDWSV